MKLEDFKNLEPLTILKSDGTEYRSIIDGTMVKCPKNWLNSHPCGWHNYSMVIHNDDNKIELLYITTKVLNKSDLDYMVCEDLEPKDSDWFFDAIKEKLKAYFDAMKKI